MKSPAFRFYPSDFWGSPDVQAMDLHEVGAYLSLLSAAWLGDRAGCLQDDDEKLRRWAKMTREQWGQSRETLLTKFPVLEPGVRANPRLYLEAQKQEAYSASQSAKGKKGGRPKAEEKPELSAEKPKLSSGLSPEKPSVSVSAFSKNKEQEQMAGAYAPDSVLSLVPKAVKAKSPKFPFSLPEWIPQDAWIGFEESRNKLRKPMTDRARRMIVTSLEKLHAEGQDPAALLDQSVLKGWADVFTLHTSTKQGHTVGPIRYSDPEAMNAR